MTFCLDPEVFDAVDVVFLIGEQLAVVEAVMLEGASSLSWALISRSRWKYNAASAWQKKTLTYLQEQSVSC